MVIVTHRGVLSLRVRLEREAILWRPAFSITLHEHIVLAIAIKTVGATILLLLDALDKA